MGPWYRIQEVRPGRSDGKSEVWLRVDWDNGRSGDAHECGKGGIVTATIQHDNVASAVVEAIRKLHLRAHGYQPELRSVACASGSVTVVLAYDSHEAIGMSACAHEDVPQAVMSAAVSATQQAIETLHRSAVAA